MREKEGLRHRGLSLRKVKLRCDPSSYQCEDKTMTELQHAPLILAILGFLVLLYVLRETRRTGEGKSGELNGTKGEPVKRRTLRQRIGDYYLSQGNPPATGSDGRRHRPGPDVRDPDAYGEGPPVRRGRPRQPPPDDAYDDYRRNPR